MAGVDNGAESCRGMRYRVTSTNLSSQFVQNEINVNYVGARPNGVNLPRILQEMGFAGDKAGSMDSNRHEISNETHNYEGGLVWSDVIARVTADAVSGEILDSELAREITRSLEQPPLEGGPRDIQTMLIFEASKVRSPSPILQDSVRGGGVRGYQGSGDVDASSLLRTSPWL